MSAAAAEAVEILVFEIGGCRYALPATHVYEVLRAVLPVPLPGAPAVVEGVINVRGSIVPVFDVRRRLGLRTKPLDHTDHFVVARAGDRRVALHVDRATQLVHLDAADVEEAKITAPALEYVAWVAKLPDDLVLIQDLHTFLSRAESAELEESLTTSVRQERQP